MNPDAAKQLRTSSISRYERRDVLVAVTAAAMFRQAKASIRYRKSETTNDACSARFAE